MKNLKILIPVYNDWDSLKLLIDEVGLRFQQECQFIIINDGSSLDCTPVLLENPNILIINLVRNLGHQRAISIGLSYICNNFPESSVIVMDGDGEDKPEHINSLISNIDNSSKIVFAKRVDRKEGQVFKLFYYLYKKIFLILTGKAINFGNFSYVPNASLKRLCNISEIWNNYPAGVIYSKIPHTAINLSKGVRLAGKSKMNHYSLIHHGLSAMSVHIESMVVRMLIFCLTALFLLILISTSVVLLKIFTTLTSPGWATTIVLGSINISMQILALLVFFTFMTLSNRSNKKIIPFYDYKLYILE